MLSRRSLIQLLGGALAVPKELLKEPLKTYSFKDVVGAFSEPIEINVGVTIVPHTSTYAEILQSLLLAFKDAYGELPAEDSVDYQCISLFAENIVDMNTATQSAIRGVDHFTQTLDEASNRIRKAQNDKDKETCKFV